jgi:hypothetical protein
VCINRKDIDSCDSNLVEGLLKQKEKKRKKEKKEKRKKNATYLGEGSQA